MDVLATITAMNDQKHNTQLQQLLPDARMSSGVPGWLALGLCAKLPTVLVLQASFSLAYD
jgi:hypothetical protein